MISFPVTRSGKHYVLSIQDSDDNSSMELIQTQNPAGAFDAQDILQAAFEKATAAALGHKEAEQPRAPRKPKDGPSLPKLTKKRVAELRKDFEERCRAGEMHPLDMLSKATGYPVAKLRKALGITEG